MAVIIDTSCLIILSRIGKLDILEKLFDDLIIPEAVNIEFGEKLPPFIKVHPQPVDERIIQLAAAFLDR
jgi:predicted nucleic acid-binding protein